MLKYLDKEVVGKVWRRGLVTGCGGTASSGVVPQTKRSQIRREGQDDEEAAHVSFGSGVAPPATRNLAFLSSLPLHTHNRSIIIIIIFILIPPPAHFHVLSISSFGRHHQPLDKSLQMIVLMFNS